VIPEAPEEVSTSPELELSVLDASEDSELVPSKVDWFEDDMLLATSLIGVVTQLVVFALGSTYSTRFSSPEVGASGNIPMSRTKASVS
jgi:hypothetical protein